MRRRDYRLTLYLNEEEMEALQQKAQTVCMDCNRFLRTLIAGYEPRPAPDERFFQMMDIMREMADEIDKVAMNADNSVNMIAVMTEARKWRMLQNAIEKEFLRPKRSVN